MGMEMALRLPSLMTISEGAGNARRTSWERRSAAALRPSHVWREVGRASERRLPRNHVVAGSATLRFSIT